MGNLSSTNNSKEYNVSLKGILGDLLAKERRGHILAIVIIAPVLYLLSQAGALTQNMSAFAFLSLMIGYCIIAVMAVNKKTRAFIEKNVMIQEEIEGYTPIKKILKHIIATLRIISIPLLISGVIYLFFFTLMGENKTLSVIGDFLPVLLASLFIFWSFSQAMSYKYSVGMWIDEKIEVNNENVNSESRKNEIMQLAIVGVITTLVASIMLSFFGDGEGLNSAYGVPIVVLITLLSQGFILWYSKDSREELMKRKDGQKIEFIWGLSLHLFASWHLLSIYRRVVSDEVLSFNLIEEVTLMVFTVVMSIWNISSRGMKKNYNLFVPENVLFWGIAFGFGYAGSVTMLAVGLKGDISSIFAVGHFVTWIALLALHKQSCKDLLTSRL